MIHRWGGFVFEEQARRFACLRMHPLFGNGWQGPTNQCPARRIHLPCTKQMEGKVTMGQSPRYLAMSTVEFPDYIYKSKILLNSRVMTRLEWFASAYGLR